MSGGLTGAARTQSDDQSAQATSAGDESCRTMKGFALPDHSGKGTLGGIAAKISPFSEKSVK